MSKFERFVYNLLVNIFSTGISVVFGIISIPFLVKFLGVDQFGLTVLFTSIFGLASMFEGGINAAIIRKLSISAAENDAAKFSRAFSFSMNLGLEFTAAVMGVALLFGHNILQIFSKISDNTFAIAERVFPICILNSALTAFVLPVVLCLFSTKHRFDIIAFIRAGIISVQVIVWYFVLKYTDYGLMGWAVSALSVTLFFIFCALTLGAFMTKGLRYYPIFADWALFKELVSLGMKASIVKISIFAINYFNPILFSIYGSMLMNTVFQAAAKGASVFTMIMGNVSGQLIPHIASCVVDKNTERIARIYMDCSRIVFSLSAFFAAMLAANYDYIFYLWLGGSLPNAWSNIANVFMWLLVVQVFASPSEVQWPILMVLNRLNAVTVFYIFRTICSISAVILMLKYTSLGVFSVVATNIPATILTIFFFMVVLAPHIRVSFIKQFINIFMRGLLFAPITAAILLVIKIPVDSLGVNIFYKLTINLAAGGATTAAAFWFLGLAPSDRSRIANLKIFKKISERFSAGKKVSPD